MSPVVSYVIPAYNHQDFVAQAIESVLNQTVRDIELIVVDDCSPDDTFKVASSYSDPRLKLIRNERNLGNSATLNRGIEASAGRYVGQLGSDDWLEPNKTAAQLRLLDLQPDLSVVSTWVDVVDKTGGRPWDADAVEAAGNHRDDLNLVSTWCIRNAICHSSAIIRRDFHDRHGLYDTGMRRVLDWDVWTRALRHGAKFGMVTDRLTHYRVQPGSMTHGDPLGGYLEAAFLNSKNMLPLIRERSLVKALAQQLDWHLTHPQFMQLPARTRWRLFGVFARGNMFTDFAAFQDWLQDDAVDAAAEERAGRLLTEVLSLPDPRAETLEVSVDWYQRRLAHLEQHVIELGATIEQQAHTIGEHQDVVAAYEKGKEEWFLPRIAHLEGQVAEREATIQERDAAIADYEKGKEEWFLPRIAHLESQMAERDGVVAALQKGKDEWFVPRIAHLEELMADRDATIADRDAAIADYQRGKDEWFLPRIAHLEGQVLERDTTIRDLDSTARRESARRIQQDSLIESQDATIAEQHRRISELETRQAALDAHRSELEAHQAGMLVPRIAELEAVARKRAEDIEALQRDVTAGEKMSADLRSKVGILSLKADEVDALRALLAEQRVKASRNRSFAADLLRAVMLRATAMPQRRTWKQALRAFFSGANGVSDARRRAVHAEFLRAVLPATGLFDAKWYAERNPDVVAAGLEPLDHYVSHGAQENRAPGRRFDPEAYLRAHPAAEGQPAIIHFLLRGLGDDGAASLPVRS